MADSSKETKKAQLNEEFWKETENDLRETQDLWWLTEERDVDGKKKTKLEVALKKGRSFKKEELLAPIKLAYSRKLPNVCKTSC